MCGIVGYLNLDGECANPDFLIAPAAAQRHRGPDHAGRYSNGPVALASQRLAIIDLAGGNQPIFNESRSVVVVYNGELYNYRERRELLQRKGHTFATASDTEVLVHGYEDEGPAFVRRLNGMFAFALWDQPRRRLMLARDPLGMKPLYYVEEGRRFWFASEIKSLLTLPHVSAALDPTALADYLTYQNIFAEKSLFQNIKKLQPGHYLLIDGGRATDSQYWDLSLEPRGGTLQANLDEYRSLLDAAVARHLISDVEVGSYVSGGYDSTAIALLSAPKLKRTLHTFTGAFTAGSFYDERPAASAVARRCGAVLHDLPITARMFWESLDDVGYAMDEPSVGSGAVPQYLVARQAARHVKVVLTGHGGDELLLGYEAYKAARLRDLAGNPPWDLLRGLGSVRRSEWPRTAYFALSRDPVRRCGLLRLFGDRRMRALLAPDLRRHVRDYDPLDALSRVRAPVRGATATDSTVYLYVKTYLATLLIQEDKVGMAHSLESRMPLCDRELVEFLLSVPVSQRLHDGTLKYFPKTALRDLYPPEILGQPKRGFPTPIALWFRGELRLDVESRLFGPRSLAGEIFDMPELRRLWARFLRTPSRGLFGYYLANQIYSVISVVVWYELFVAGRALPRSRAAVTFAPREPSSYVGQN